jgi:ATP-dependent protease ClpP protease subunit
VQIKGGKEMTDIEKEDSGTLELIKEVGSASSNGKCGGIHCLTIIGQIEGHYALGEGQKATKYEHIIPMLVSIEEDENVGGVLIVLNTMGGDVEAGLALAEMISSMKKPTVSLVLGGGHSIGVPLAVSAKRSFIVPSATMTIHPVRINGLVVGVPQTFNYFSEMQKRIISFICRNSNADAETLNSLMMRPDMIATDVGSIISGEEAVKYGIIDKVGGLADAVEALRGMIKEKSQVDNFSH